MTKSQNDLFKRTLKFDAVLTAVALLMLIGNWVSIVAAVVWSVFLLFVWYMFLFNSEQVKQDCLVVSHAFSIYLFVLNTTHTAITIAIFWHAPLDRLWMGVLTGTFIAVSALAAWYQLRAVQGKLY